MKMKMKRNKSKEEKMAKEEETTQDTVDKEQGDTVKNESDAQEEPADDIDEVQQWKDKFLRLYSEFENYKRRTLKERIDLIQTANEKLLNNLIPVLDDYDRAITSLEDSGADKAQKEGTLLIYNKFKAILEQNGLKPMDAMGKEFNTEYHEAIANMPVEDTAQKGMVIDVVEKGYFINEKVLRYAKVVVGA